MVIYEIIFGGMHPVVFISMMCMYTEIFHDSVKAPNATIIIYEI